MIYTSTVDAAEYVENTSLTVRMVIGSTVFSWMELHHAF